MSVADAVQAALDEQRGRLQSSPGFLELQRFYEEMKRLGLVSRPEYSLPLVDTIGRTEHGGAPPRTR